MFLFCFVFNDGKIVEEALKQAGIRNPGPLLTLCLTTDERMLFAYHSVCCATFTGNILNLEMMEIGCVK